MMTNRKKKNRGLAFVALLLIAAVLLSLYQLNKGMGEVQPPHAAEIELYSGQAVLVDLASGKVVFKKNANQKVYPASLTKIMTAIVAIEENTNNDKKTQLNQAIFEPLYKENASMAGFLPGETASLIDLVYGTLLPSGAEAAIGLALATAGSQKQFVKRMNEKAKKLGMKGTHYENVTGLHAKGHYTTAKDMVTLLCYSLKNDLFRKAFTSRSYTVAPTNLHGQGFTFQSTLFSKLESDQLHNGKIVGGKTGFTNEAGLCLASLAEQGGREYALVTLGAKGGPDTPQYNLLDATLIYNTCT